MGVSALVGCLRSGGKAVLGYSWLVMLSSWMQGGILHQFGPCHSGRVRFRRATHIAFASPSLSFKYV